MEYVVYGSQAFLLFDKKARERAREREKERKKGSHCILFEQYMQLNDEFPGMKSTCFITKKKELHTEI